MPVKRGHVAPQNTYIVTLIRDFDPHYNHFIASNALFLTKPIIYCSDGLCEMFGYTKAQFMLKSAVMKMLYGSDTSDVSIETICHALTDTKETEILMNLYTRDGAIIPCKISVTPVRDETDQLPLYLLFFHRDGRDHSNLGSVTKRSSLRSRLGMKSLRQRDSLNLRRNLGYSEANVPTNISTESDRVGSPDFRDTTIAKIDALPNQTNSSTPNRVVRTDAPICDQPEHVTESEPHGKHKQPRTRSLFVFQSSDATSDFDSSSTKYPNLHPIPTPSSLHVSTPHSDRLTSRRRPLTWYNSQHQQLPEESEPVLLRPTPARGRRINSLHTPDSEALRLVLSNHPEPTKASVTEKFAQFLSMDEDLHVEHRFQSPYMHRFTLKHYSVFKAIWDWIILVLIIFTAIATPFVTAFSPGYKDSRSPNRTIFESKHRYYNHPLSIVEVLVDVMFFVDIIINFRTTYVNKNDEVVSHPRRIATHYLKGWFFIDLVAAIPFDLIIIQSGGTDISQHEKLNGLLKSARLLRLVGIVRKLDRYSEYGASILLLLTALFALIAHWLACIWYAIGSHEYQQGVRIGWLDALSKQTLEPHSNESRMEPNTQTKYITALYFTFSSLTSIGFGNVSPNTNAEKVFSIVVMLVGSLMYASIFGNVGALIQRLYSGTARYHAQMLRIKEFIRFHQIPSPLRQRLEEYSTQVWEHTNGIDMTMVQYSFPESLQSDICLYVYRDFLNGSPAFKSLNDGCLRNISLRIRVAHMPPSDTLIHTGDLLSALYYVVKGSLEVVTTDDLILGVLNPGDYFGGLPTLLTTAPGGGQHAAMQGSFYPAYNFGLPSPGGQPSIASTALLGMSPPPKSRFAVRALTYTDVQFIDRHDLVDLCNVYPKLAIRILEKFELTIPLTSPSSSAATRMSHTPPWFANNSSLDSFLLSHAIWNPVPVNLLSTLVPLFTRGQCRLNTEHSFFHPNHTDWELERLQRLFIHGVLSQPSTPSSTTPATVAPSNPRVDIPVSSTHYRRTSHPTTFTTSGHFTSSTKTVMTSEPVSFGGRGGSDTHDDLSSQVSSKEHHKLRWLFARSRSPHSDLMNRLPRTQTTANTSNSVDVPNDMRHRPDNLNLSHRIDSVAAADLLASFSRVERKLQQLDERISDTIGVILTRLQPSAV